MVVEVVMMTHDNGEWIFMIIYERLASLSNKELPFFFLCHEFIELLHCCLIEPIVRRTV